METPEARISIGPFDLACSESNTELIDRFITVATAELDRRHAAREARYREEANKNAAMAEALMTSVAPWLESLFGNRRNSHARPDIDVDTSGDAH